MPHNSYLEHSNLDRLNRLIGHEEAEFPFLIGAPPTENIPYILVYF